LLFFSGASHASIDTTALHVLGLRGDQMVSKGAGKIKKGVYEIGPLSWVGLEKKYFSLLLKEDQTLESLQAKMEGEDHWLLQAKLTPIELAGHQSQTDKLLLYAGPTRLTELKAYGVGFEKVFSQGWLGFLHVVFLWLLNFFFRFLHNFGLAILALTLLIRIILSPLMHFSFDSMKKMQDVQPKIEALKQQYNKDPQKLNQEMMELFKRNKVNPFGGCLPMVIQIPIFIALWQVLSHSIELKGAPFYFWITDLSLQDHLFTLPFTLPWFGNVIALLPILTTITMLLQQMLTPTTTSAPEQKMMMWMMSVIFGVMFYKLPSGVLLYWCASNIITIIHQMMLFKKGPFRPRPA
jgi:YidC/Oxa1 family membrane protein insertase